MTYYHGTSVGNIKIFSFGVRGVGEQLDPVNCIWLCSKFSGAKYHATQVVGHIHKTKPNYVYSVTLPQSHVIADTRSPDTLAPAISKQIIKVCLGWRRFIYRGYTWLEAIAFHIDCSAPQGDSARKNEIFSILRCSGVDALITPNFTWQKKSGLMGRYEFHLFDFQGGGNAIALLNLQGVQVGVPKVV